MDRHNPFPDDHGFDEALGEAVRAVRSEPISPEATRRVVQRAKQLQPRPRRTWWARRLQIAGSVAAALLLSVLLLSASSPDALAQVAAAIGKQPWLHAVGQAPDGRPIELWYSAHQGILAHKDGDHVTFVDHRLGVMELYRGDESVYRVPTRGVGNDSHDEVRRQLQALLSGDLEQAFRSPAQRVVSHEQRQIQIDDRQAVEHRFVVQFKDDDDAATQSILRADPTSHLPFWWEQRKGSGAIQFQISYPESGPESVHALGVPRSATLVDQVPRGDLPRILASLRTAPRRFDNYRAVVIHSASADPREDGYVHYQIWRKGTKWRIEQFRVKPYGETRAPEDVDPAQWWLRHAKTCEAYPVAISDGQVEWLFEAIPAVPRRPDPRNPDYLLFQSLRKERKPFDPSPFDPADPRPHEHERVMPEFYGYPPLGRATAAGFRTHVEPNPRQGPKDAVLVEITDTDQHSRGISGFRYWIDPVRSHLVVRREWLSGPAKGSQVQGASEIVQTAQTPKGYHYPTVVRVPDGSVHMETGKKSDDYFRFYLEFDVEMPDALFDPANAEAP